MQAMQWQPKVVMFSHMKQSSQSMSALTVMLSVSKQLRQCSDLSQATGAVDRVPALMLEALKDLTACQGPQSSVGDIGSGHPFL